MTTAPPLTVADLMTHNPVRLRPDERLDIALALMVSCRFRHLPVEANGKLAGIVSLRDLQAADLSGVTASRGARALHLRGLEARQVMSTNLVTVAPDDSWLCAAQLLLDRPISCLPVLEEGRLVGIVSATDFLRPTIALLERETAERNRPIAVAALMTGGPVVTLRAGDHLDLSRTLMTVHRVRHLPVVDGERVVGLVSDHDLLRAEASALAPPAERLRENAQLLVREVMTPRVVTIASDEPAVDGARVLLRRRFGALPVLSSHKLVGMLTVRDYFHHLLSCAPPAQAAAG